MALAITTVDQTIQGGVQPQLLPWEMLRDHPLLTTGVDTAEWAERHSGALHHNIETIFADPANRPKLRADLDEESGDHIFRITGTLPDLAVLYRHFPRAVADVAGNLRSVLDQLAWQMASTIAPNGQPPDPNGVKFPISDLPGSFTKEGRARNQIAPPHWAFVESFQPYHGVDGRLDTWSGAYAHQLTLLRELANDHKHRITQPVLLVPNQFELLKFDIVERLTPFGPQPDWEFRGVGTPLVLNAEVFRARLAPGAEPHVDKAGQFAPQVAMAEGRPVIFTLNRLLRFVQLIFSEFSRQFPVSMSR